ncbi:hypothetical protein Syun_015164 [Stephania yunnanensis]|uniref:Uncharacterized protein n=1 Tax=Stephania yunnanensis TaxID=152371 RepID=A0AAP0PAB4_9MAGN
MGRQGRNHAPTSHDWRACGGVGGGYDTTPSLPPSHQRWGQPGGAPTIPQRRYMSALGNKKVKFFDMGAGGSDPIAEDNVQLASAMSNQELIDAGNKKMDKTDQAIERSKQLDSESSISDESVETAELTEDALEEMEEFDT